MRLLELNTNLNCVLLFSMMLTGKGKHFDVCCHSERCDMHAQ